MWKGLMSFPSLVLFGAVAQLANAESLTDTAGDGGESGFHEYDNSLSSLTGGATVFSILQAVKILWGDERVHVFFPGVDLELYLPGIGLGMRPSIEGPAPFVVTAGNRYYFKPTASDPQGTTLTFSALNLPAWAVFDAVSGELMGTPGLNDIGTYSNITLSVSNGTETASMTPFAVSVIEEKPDSALLTWVRPEYNTDGSELIDLAGYRIAYGNSIDTMNNVLDIPGADSLSIEVEGLSSGTWHFSVQAINSEAINSEWSPVVSKTL